MYLRTHLKLLLTFIILSFIASVPVHSKSQASDQPSNYIKICEDQKLFILEDKDISFSDNEKQLICGSSVPGWQEPLQEQANRQIELSLRARGYYQPQIKSEGDAIYVDPGQKTLIQTIQYNTLPPRFAEISYIGVIDQDLNSENIERLAQWTEARLKAIGYPCPRVEVKASYIDSKVYVEITPGEKVDIGRITRPQLEGLYDEALFRFDAISSGEEFNGDYLELTSRRLMSSQIASYSYMTYKCQGENPDRIVSQHVETNEPRYLGFAIGASTEEFPLVKLQWLHSRLDKQASSLEAEAYLSSIKQSFLLDYDGYWFKKLPRFYVTSKYEIANVIEDTNETLTQKIGAGGGYIYDFKDDRLALESTPLYTIEDSFEGDAPRHSEYLSLETSLVLTSHYYEYFMASPRFGHQLKLFWKTQNDQFSAADNADLYQTSGTIIWNHGKFDPPVAIFGIRFAHSILRVSDLGEAPQSYRLYLGGNKDLRGFSRKSVNNQNKGYQTTSYLGFESRFTKVLPYQLQPFVFYDFAKVGLEDHNWTDTLLSSPGVGLRWQSPIGTFRTTAGHGFLDNTAPSESDLEQEWTFFLSFGREF